MSGPFRLVLAAAVVWATQAIGAPPAGAQCAVDARLFDADGLKIDVVYRCKASQPLSFEATEHAVHSHVSGLKTGQKDGIAEARYRFDLSAYARAVDSTSLAVARGTGVLATLGSWLLEPRGYAQAPTIDIRMATGPGLAFAAGLPQHGEAWRLTGTTVRFAGYTALGRFTYREIAMPGPGSMRAGQSMRSGAVLRVAILDGVDATGRADLLDWVERTAAAQSNYWQGFTAPQALLGLVPTRSRRAVGHGRTVPGGGATMIVEVGMEVDRRRLFEDWVLTHELIHTGMPFIRGRGTWLMEGTATYVEPIIRARAGWKTEEAVWQEWLGNMPQGQSAFTIGLANASGRQNYWAGATLLLVADVTLRRTTRGAKGIEDCLRGVLWSGLDAAKRVSLDDYVAGCDRATGTDVMRSLVERHVTRPTPLDLAALWKELGVSMVAGRVVLDDTVPDAAWRRMIVPGIEPGRRVALPWQN